MKPTIIIAITILLMPIALGTAGGDTWTYNFPHCDWLSVNITADLTIDDGEYTVHNENCTEIYADYFECNCTDNYVFNMTFAARAFNVYELSFNHNYSKEVSEEETDDDSSSSGGGGKGGRLITGLTKDSKTTTLNYGDVFSFYINGSKHRIIILKVTASEIKIKIYSRVIELTMKEGETREVDVDDDGINDFRIELKEIKKLGGLFKFTIIDEVAAVEEKEEEPEQIVSEIVPETEIISETVIDDGVEPVEVKESKLLVGILIFVGVLVVCGGGYFLYIKKFRKKKLESFGK